MQRDTLTRQRDTMQRDQLEALRCIVGAAPSDDALLLLLRDSSVEAAANRFFDEGVPKASLATFAGAAQQLNSGKRAAGAEPIAPAQGKHQKRAAASCFSAPAALSAQSAPAASSAPMAKASTKPLAERMRPTHLDELVGQGEALDAVLRQALEHDRLPSLILWGPPGCGKTSFAACVAGATKRIFRSLSAAKAGVAELREELSRAANASRLRGVGTILFVDELHRWSKAQQDAVLLDCEKGVVTLIGATTENPSFAVNNAILSRCRLVVFQKVADAALSAVLDRALASDEALAGGELTTAARQALISAADGDARVALNVLELAAATVNTSAASVNAAASANSASSAATTSIAANGSGALAVPSSSATAAGGAASASWQVDEGAVLAAVQRRAAYYDRNGDFHYDLISALHKSLRGGDADGALYYAARMLAGGEDPRYVTRRLIRFASEDVGLADPRALQQAVAADQAVHAIGMPECGVCIAQCVVFLALAPKSCAVYAAFNSAMAAATSEPKCPVPIHLRNAPTKLMKSIGYGMGYVYNPGDGYRRGCAEGYLPPELGSGRTFFDANDCEPGHALEFCGDSE